MPPSFGYHRMSSSCARNATASGGVTFMRVFSFLIPASSPACSSPLALNFEVLLHRAVHSVFFPDDVARAWLRRSVFARKLSFDKLPVNVVALE